MRDAMIIIKYIYIYINIYVLLIFKVLLSIYIKFGGELF